MWTTIREFTDIKFERTADGIAKITINRPEVRNAFRPLTVSEMKTALDMARDDSDIGVIILTGQGPEAFCSGGDQRVRGKGGYVDEKEKIPRLNILDVQKQIRSMPKPSRQRLEVTCPRACLACPCVGRGQGTSSPRLTCPSCLERRCCC